jgi:2'-5' RNA ligase
LRTFIAIDISSEILRKIDEITSFLKTQTPPDTLKWVAIQNLHLTLKFLGEISADQVNNIKSLTASALKDFKAFNMSIEGLGMYPNPNKVRVVWLGCKNGQSLIRAYEILDRTLASGGIEREKRSFSPHLTIGRVRRGIHPSVVKQIGETLSQFRIDHLGSFQVSHIRLYQSTLTPSGPIYKPLLTIPLDTV